jgi:hypothetical protein
MNKEIRMKKCTMLLAIIATMAISPLVVSAHCGSCATDAKKEAVKKCTKEACKEGCKCKAACTKEECKEGCKCKKEATAKKSCCPSKKCSK